ncbi:MAG: PilZ domain-containing protein [Myxococcota bacterium]|nr:PilZ domain-containing protein [Myxococcota bacterium]
MKRQQYRVTDALLKEIGVRLTVGRRRLPAILLDMAQGGAGLALEEKYASELKHKAEVKLYITSERLNSPLVIKAEIRHVRRGFDDVRVGLEFEDWGGERSTLGPRLLSLFNERRAFRVSPPHSQRIPVYIVTGTSGTQIQAMLKDVSLLGIGLFVRKDEVGPLQDEEGGYLKFRLPRDRRVIKFAAEVRHVQRGERFAEVGMEFIREHSGLYAGIQSSLTRYVMHRQQENANRAFESKE